MRKIVFGLKLLHRPAIAPITWITKDGEKVRVIDMNDPHLFNAYMFCERQIQDLQLWIDVFAAEAKRRGLKVRTKRSWFKRRRKNKMKCTECEEELDEEEAESPQRDKGDNILCDHCFEEQYTHFCPICGETFDEDFSKAISPKYLLITEDASEDLYLAQGIYEIVSYPFFCDGMIEISLIESAIKKILDPPKDVCENDICYVCGNCVNKIKNKERKAKNKLPGVK